MSSQPLPDCPLCPRLVAHRHALREREPDWHNAPVPSFGPIDARLLIVGLAPGERGANRTGRPFTGDHAGTLLYAMLARHGFSRGVFDARPDDGLQLTDARIANAVRCLPPQNKPTGAEAANCRPFLVDEIETMTSLRAILCLGRISHDAVLRTLGERLAAHPFAHGARHAIGTLTVWDSYHCSRYNTNTGRLTEAMFTAVFESIREDLDRR